MLKTWTVRSTLLAAACSMALCAPVMADTPRKVDIPAGELTSALQRLAEQSGAEFMYSADRLKGVHTNGVQGEYTPEQAVMKLLEGTSLKLLVGESGALLISDKAAPATAYGPQKVSAISMSSGSRLRLSQAADPVGDGRGEASNTTRLEEIVVTATKRKERLRDLAGAASATTGVQLSAIGAQSNADYLGRLPGVVFNEGTSGQSTVTIRGIGTTAGVDQGQGPTGYFINEVPLAEPSYASGIPDIDTFDLDRVEVLRGPQGTLFGSSSLGGAVNYIVKTADPAQFDAATETTVRSIDHSGGDLSYTAKAMFNLPLITDKLAVRVVGSTRYDAGYISNVGTGVEDANDTEVNGVRASIVFSPTETTRLSLLSLYQENQLDDFQAVQSTYGRYHRSTHFPAPSEYNIELHSLRLDQDVSFANLTVLASTHDKDHVLDSDVTASSAVRTFVPNGVLSREDFTTTMQTIEARLSSKDGGLLKWVFGAMYSDTESKVATLSIAPGGAAALAARYNPALLQGDMFNRGYSFRNGYEKALFGEASLTFAQDWTLTLGGRLFDTRYALRLERYGIQAPTGPLFIPEREAMDDGFVPKISLAYRPTSDHTIYALASKGFRFGNPNTVADLPGFDTPSSWESDELWNYELGSHSVLMDGMFQLDASVFYIDWKDIQVRLVRPDNLTYGTNAGTARSRGVELAAAIRPIDPMTLTTNVTYLDSELTQTVTIASPPLLDGTQLPGASEWQISNTLTYNFDTVLSPSVILSHRYLSDAPETLQQPYVRVAGYNQFDVRTNFDLGRLDLGLFVTNLTDRRAVSFGYGISATGSGRNEFITRPRTFGITLNWNFNQ
ncbi:TonB-dependent receptor domain-containing protein [Peristeroidobacter soli]|uniref:TonB-dependent receptor domain-containing protein n=1 Tax=Peristeroidobacter soli TaxID=2497877 RepID=UPI00101DD79C|nr:TonB-dependent receptor [Peristeroidobacter soli]